MKISSIDPKTTSGLHKVVFNVAGRFESAVLAKVRHPTLQLTAVSGKLCICSPDVDARPIGKAEIATITKLYAAAEKRFDADESGQKVKRQRMLEQVADSTGLPLGAG